MCSSYFSSAIAQEDTVLYGSKKHMFTSPQRTMALKDIIDFLPYAENIYFAGGEPLLTAEHYEILEQLIKCGNTNLKLNYNTNFTKTTFRQQSVFDLWCKFENVNIGASLDAEGSVAEYVRHGTDWQKIEENFVELKNRCPHVKFTVTSTVGFLNVTSLINLQKNWVQSGWLDACDFFVSMLISPDHLSLQVLPFAHKQRLKKIMLSHVEWCNTHKANTLAKSWQDAVQFMLMQDTSHCLTEFRRLTKTMDDYRKESFALTFPEFQELLEYDQS
jgi:hypothetical protein